VNRVKIDILNKNLKKNAFNLLTDMFANPVTGNAFLDHKYAVLTTLRSRYSQKPPKITLGTILCNRNGSSTSYWLCIQPKCDCVRLDGKVRSFPMLPLGIKGDVQIVIPTNNENYERFHVSLKPYECNMLNFLPANDEDEIKGLRKDNSFLFIDTNNKIYEWIAELKFEYAQRIANKFAAQISRVGVDNSEYLRRWEEKGSN